MMGCRRTRLNSRYPSAGAPSFHMCRNGILLGGVAHGLRANRIRGSFLALGLHSVSAHNVVHVVYPGCGVQGHGGTGTSHLSSVATIVVIGLLIVVFVLAVLLRRPGEAHLPTLDRRVGVSSIDEEAQP
jgi:hypothetical protein